MTDSQKAWEERAKKLRDHYRNEYSGELMRGSISTTEVDNMAFIKILADYRASLEAKLTELYTYSEEPLPPHIEHYNQAIDDVRSLLPTIKPKE